MAGNKKLSIVPYGPPIQEAIATGDIVRMKQLVEAAEQFLQQNGDISAALELLKIEIAKLSSEAQ